ncbi:MAG: hypothetical protein LVS60_15965 [Nodosilinea sp. LVE1205-7]|jgi:hypothetical protein
MSAEDLIDEASQAESVEDLSPGSDVTDAISQLTGSWTYPGNFQSDIVIEPGDASDQVVARDLADQHWSYGNATVRIDSWDDVNRVQVDISFNTGVQVSGTVSQDFATIEWDNGTRWERG